MYKLSGSTYSIVLLLRHKFICDKSARGKLINPPIVFTFTRQRWSSSTCNSYLALLLWRSNIRIISHPPTSFILQQVYCENSLRGYFKVAIRGLCGKMSIIIDINKKLFYKNSKWWVEFILYIKFLKILHQTQSAPNFLSTNKFRPILASLKWKTQLFAILKFI
jgi:hypothetical protein